MALPVTVVVKANVVDVAKAVKITVIAVKADVVIVVVVIALM